MKQIELIGPPLYQWDTGRRHDMYQRRNVR